MRFSEPLLLPFASVAVGVAVASSIDAGNQRFSLAESCIAGGALAVLGLAGYFAGSRRIAHLTCCVALVFAGTAMVAARPPHPPPTLSVPDNAPAIFEGCVADPALLAVDRERFTIELAPGARAQVSLSSRPSAEHPDGFFPDLPYGTHIEFTGKVRQTHNYNDPGAFDNVQYLARQHIYWNASGDAATVHVLGGRCGNPLARFIFAIRTGALSRLDRLYADDAYSNGMMQAILIGATAKLDKMWTEDYRSTGTFHALVISGGHVAVLAAVLLFFLRICAVPRGIAIFLTVLAAWLYAGVTGWQAPVLRSAAGMTLYGIGRIFFREGRLLNLLAAIALLFVAVEPQQLFDASFQLSFLAVALIGAFVVPALDATSAPLSRGLANLKDVRKDVRLAPKSAQFRVEMRLLAETLFLALHVPRRTARGIVSIAARCSIYLWEIFVTSFFIQIGLALPMVVYFHRTSVSGLTANAIVVPVLSAIVPLGFLAIALNSAAVAHLCAWLLLMAKAAVGMHARWEPDWRIPGPPFWLAALFVGALILAALRVKHPAGRWLRAAGWIATAAALAAIVIHPFTPAVERGKFELSAIDVGQGDSLLVSFPQGRLMLIDAGGIPSFGRKRKPGIDIGEDVVSPYLWSRSIQRLDIVAMTHAHEDHMGGMGAVLRNFHPRELWIGATGDSPEWRSVRDEAARLRIPVRRMLRARPFGYGGATIEVLAPGPDYVAGEMPKNDDSLVMRIRFGATSFLLTGDMEKGIEHELAYDGLLSHDDVLKVGHHGSKTSSTPELLDLERPEFGIISAGFDNSYGHPSPSTLRALAERRVTVFRTDEEGLITVVSDGRRLRFAWR